METVICPKTAHEDFVKRSVAINRLFYRVGAVFGVVTQLFNMFRVLVLTNTKLGTLNNRIYFGFYLSFFLVCSAYLVIDRFAKLSVEAQYRLNFVLAGVALSWSVLFNLYDVYRADAIGYFTVTTIVFMFTGLCMYKPAFTLTCLGLCYAAFVLSLNLMYSSGEVINFTVTVLLCTLMYLVRFRHQCIELEQEKRILDVQRELTDVRRDFRMTVEQYRQSPERETSISFEWDIHGDWIRFSKEWKRYFTYPEEITNVREFLQSSQLLSEDHKQALLVCMENIKNGLPYQKHEFLLPVQTGENRWFEMYVVTQKNDRGEPFFGIGILSDVTEQKRRVDQLETEIQMDLFTGLLNKTSVEHYGERRLAELQDGEKMLMLILDMDDFKNINDRFGHPVGDYVIREIASLMRKHAPVGARIGRIGGDEFIALTVSRDETAFEGYADTLLRETAEIRWKGTDISSSCSIGIASVSSSGKTYAELYRKADQALYEAKNRGKGQRNSDGLRPE